MHDILQNSKAWPFEQARKILARIEKTGQNHVLFETGFGASGLPHIGTFGEVVRTTMVRHALHRLAPSLTSKLICFSDDMDALRKVPDNVPNRAMLTDYLEKPLTAIPDPFGTHDSFGAHNNARLRAFLDRFGFDYEFASSTQYYKSGKFDASLCTVLREYDAVMDIILPTLGEARRQSYSPFLPICPHSGKVLMVPICERDNAAGKIAYMHPDTGARVETLVTGGACKLQWKADWALRWHALGVDYEMAGKDLDESVALSSRICQQLGGIAPEGFSYELFLDDKGQKISKSKGNGISIDEWLAYAPPESLSLFMFQSPRKAKRLYFDVIPKNVDDYITFLQKFSTQEAAAQFENPAWHIHAGDVPACDMPISFGLLLNLVSASHAQDKATLWGFIHAYAPDVTAETVPLLDMLVDYALVFYRDFIHPTKSFRLPTETERQAMQDLSEVLEGLPSHADAQTIQNAIYAVGKTYFVDNLRDWFKALYEVLLGQSQGPRFGSFIALYGMEPSLNLIRAGLNGELVAA